MSAAPRDVTIEDLRSQHTWFPYLYLDVRHGGRVVSQAVVTAVGVSAQGRREILGLAVGDSENTDFWTQFLRDLRERGLSVPTATDPCGVQLVISDAHAGLKAAVKAILPGTSWQRCRVHVARNVTQALGSARSKPVNAVIGTIFAQTSPEAVRSTFAHVTDSLTSVPRVGAMLLEAEHDLTAFAAFPIEHWRKIWSNNSVKRFTVAEAPAWTRFCEPVKCGSGSGTTTGRVRTERRWAQSPRRLMTSVHRGRGPLDVPA